jgi:hypothetical protein
LRNRSHCFAITEQAVIGYIHRKIGEVAELKELDEKVCEGQIDPYSGAEQFLQKLFGSADILKSS